VKKKKLSLQSTCAITLSGHVVDEVASCASCLNVNRDFFLGPPPSGDEAWKGCEEDIYCEAGENFHCYRASIVYGTVIETFSSHLAHSHERLSARFEKCCNPFAH
jgi:hypothetical protein